MPRQCGARESDGFEQKAVPRHLLLEQRRKNSETTDVSCALLRVCGAHETTETSASQFASLPGYSFFSTRAVIDPCAKVAEISSPASTWSELLISLPEESKISA